MKELKQMLRQKYSISNEALHTQQTEMPPNLRDQMSAEISSLQTVYGQATEQHFKDAANYLWESETVYVTGFQTVRGLARRYC